MEQTLFWLWAGEAPLTRQKDTTRTANPGTALWDIWTQKVPLTKSLPVGVVLTIAAAGSEMSDSAVLTNEAIGRKQGLSTDFNRVKFAIMNPEAYLHAAKILGDMRNRGYYDAYPGPVFYPYKGKSDDRRDCGGAVADCH